MVRRVTTMTVIKMKAYTYIEKGRFELLDKPGLSVSMIPLHLVQEKRDVVISYQIGPSSQSISLDMSEYLKERNAYDSLMFFKNRFEKYLGY